VVTTSAVTLVLCAGPVNQLGGLTWEQPIGKAPVYNDDGGVKRCL
jgi:hypothetical protein